MEKIDWNSQAILYIVDVNGKSKLGVCSNWDQQESQYKRDYSNQSIQLIMKVDFDHYWQAELVEQIMKLRLKPYINQGLHEWLKEDFHLPVVFDYYKEVSSLLSEQYSDHEHIHRKGNNRWAFYNRVYEDLKIYFKK